MSDIDRRANPGAAESGVADLRVPLPQLVRRRAQATPDALAFSSVVQGGVTWAELAGTSHAWALSLRDLGIAADDHVVTLVPQSLEACFVWLACCEIGAVEVSINTEFRGAWLSGAIRTSGASTVVASSRFLPQLRAVIDDTEIVRVIVYDAPDFEDSDFPCQVVSISPARSRVIPEAPGRVTAIADTACVLYTSGTTGQSKAVEIPWGLLYALCTVDPLDEETEQTFYVPYAPFHLSGRSALYRAAIHGGHSVVRESFSTSDFWADVRTHGCTWSLLYSAPTRFLAALPAGGDEGDNPLRSVLMCPLVPEVETLKARWGVEVYSVYGMTEIGAPLRLDLEHSDSEHARAGACGRPVDGVEARLVDAQDMPVERGEPGELILRSDLPWTFTTGYFGMPEVTLRAWRNGWFHTGDVFVQDPDGSYRYVDRNKDMIRRRGENVSSAELESAILTHPDIAAAAAVGLPSELGDEEILIVVVPIAGAAVDPAALVGYLEAIVPRFALPAFVRVVTDLPRTQATQRVQKSQLRKEGLTADVWRAPVRHRAGAARREEERRR